MAPEELAARAVSALLSTNNQGRNFSFNPLKILAFRRRYVMTAKLTSSQIEQREFIEMLKQIAQAARAMRRNAEDIDRLLEDAHLIPLAT